MFIHGVKVAAALALVSASAVFAEQPGQAPPNAAAGPGGPSVPSAGYRRTVELLRLTREAGVPGIAAAPGVNLALSGVRSVPVICVEYKNRPHHFGTDAYQSLLFDEPNAIASPPNPTFTQYYRDISNGQFVPIGQVFGWYKLPEDDTFYELNNNGLNERLVDLLTFAFQKADADVDFGQFDNDGPDGLPNSGDDDGIVDTIFIIHSEKGGECGPDGVNKNMWSHSFQYSAFSSTTGPFTTNDVRRDEHGQPMIGVNNKIRIEDYTVQPGLSCASTTAGPEMIPIGVFCHEYGHALGLPDLYDRTPTEGADSEGVGNYCLMAGGSYGANGGNAAVPVHMSAWCKSLLGWATIVEIQANQQVSLEAAAERNLVYNVDVPGTGGKEFFLIEFRDGNWTDRFGERLNWDREFDPSGIAVWHVDERVGEASPEWPFAAHDEGQNDSPSVPNSAGTAYKPKRSLVALIQRDRMLHLERNQNRGDDSDLYLAGEEFADDSDLRAGSRSYAATPSGLSLRSIDFDNSTAMIRVDDFPPGHTPAPPPVAALAFHTPRDNDEQIVNVANSAAAIEATTAQQIQAKTMQAGADALSDRELWQLAAKGASYVQQSLPPNQAQQVLSRFAAQRTRSIEKGAEDASELDDGIKQIIAASTTSTATVRVAPNNEQIERLSGIRVAIGDKSPAADANDRIKELLPALATESTTLDFEHPKVAKSQVTFPQIVKVDGKAIRMQCRGITLYYDSGDFVGVESNTIEPETLKITGTSRTETNDEILSRISEQLHVARDRLQLEGQCIVLKDGMPEDARVATQVNVKVGGSRDDIHVFVDNESGKVLEIK